jgi:hypothetical protein
MVYNLGKKNTLQKSNIGKYSLGEKKIVSKSKTESDLSTIEGLTSYAKEAGLDEQVNAILDSQTPKLGFLQRLGKGLGAFNPAEAILTGTEKGIGSGVIKYGEGIVKGIGSAITGKDIEGERRYFSDVAEKYGIENGIAKFGIGFLGDVLLDPTTYFGGAMIKGVLGATKKASNIGLKTVGKFAPEAETGLRMASDALSDALGATFKAGYKTSKGFTDDVMGLLGKQEQAKIGLAKSNLERLGTGILTEEQSGELAMRMIAGKRAEFTAREVAKSVEEQMAKVGLGAKKQLFPEIGAMAGKETALKGSTGVVKETIEQQITRTSKFGKELVDNPYEVYFPFIKKDKLEKFVYETRGLRVGSEGYKKQFKNILTNEAMETNPARAFWTRESQIVTDKITRNFLKDTVNKYGKPLEAFKGQDDALKAGYDLIREKGIFGKDIGYLPKWDKKFLTDMFSPEFKSIDVLAKATGFDAITSLFKRSVTGLFAPFHIRNYVSGHIQNFEALGIDSLNPKNISVGQKIAYNISKGIKPEGTIEMAGKTAKFEDIFKPFYDRYANATFYMNEYDNAIKVGSTLEDYTKIISKESLKKTIQTAGLSQSSIPFRVGRAIGNFIETSQKATAYVTALNQGKSINEALKLAEVAGFDYRMLTKFESQIMKRLIPFYSFTRKNIELQMKTLGENPQRINQVIKFFENVGERPSEEEKQGLPSYISEGFGIKLPDTADGLKQYISQFGTPIESFTQLFSGNAILNALSMTNPILKTPIEIGIGKDSFREKDLKDVYNASEYSKAPQVIKDLLQIKEVKKSVFNKDKNGKLIKTGERIEYVANPERLLIARGLFTSRGVSYLDQIFDGDLKGFVKFLKLTTGIKPQQIDLEVSKYLKDKDQKRAIEDLLIKMGALKEYRNVYEPKQ